MGKSGNTFLALITGAAIGAGKPRLAKKYRNVSLLLGFMAYMLVAVCGLAAREKIITFYEPDAANSHKGYAKNDFGSLLNIMLTLAFGFCYFVDSLQLICCGILRACGESSFNGKFFLVQHYVLGLPLTFFLV